MRLSSLICTLIFLSSIFSVSYAGEIEQVSLITCGPGKQIYELEGHTALRLKYDDGRDLSVNWGVFDFAAPNFIYRFVKGETDYQMAVYPFTSFLSQYASDGRWIYEQDLNLTPAEMKRLEQLIDSTLISPVYRYNYVKDNCATRPVQYIADAIGRPITLGVQNGILEPTETFRQDMTYYHKNYPWYQFGIDLALGSGIDYKLDSGEHYFAPVALRTMAETAFYPDSTGRFVSLVTSERILSGNPEDISGSATPWYFTPLFVCWVFFFITLGICLYDWKKEKLTLWFFSLYYTLAFLAGMLLTFLIFVSVHEATSPNWLYLWLNPLCLVGALFIWIKKLEKAVFYWQILNFVALTILAVVCLLGVQHLNPAFVPLIVSDAILSLTWINSTTWGKR